MEYLDVYDEAGKKTGEVVERNEAHRKGILHKVVHVWIINSKNELLMQKRSKNKDLNPDKWYVSMGGHIESGETNAQTIIREFKEELALDVSSQIGDVEYLHTFKEAIIANEGAFWDYAFYDVHVLRREVDLSQLLLQEDEVQEVKFMGCEDFKRAVLERDETFWIHEEGFDMLFAALDQMVRV
jgi:isopentenyldiphosphate isomerase